MQINLIQGSILLFLVVVLYLQAYRYFKSDKISRSLALIVMTGLILRIFCALDPIPHPWDERYHALVASNMIAHPLKPTLLKEDIIEYDYTSWANNHIWLHKQPFPLWTMALSMYIFDKGTFSMRLPSVVLSTIAIFLTYLIGAFLFNKRIGLFAAFFCSINGLIIEISAGRVATDHIDLFFLFFIQLAIVFIVLHQKKEKSYLIFLAGFSVGIAILCKWLPALIVIPIFWILNFDRYGIIGLLKKTTVLFLTACLVALPWQIFAAIEYPREYWYEYQYNIAHLLQPLGGQGHPWWFHIDKARIVWNEMIYVAFGWLIWHFFRDKYSKNSFALIFWIVIPYLFFSIAITKMQGYLLFTGPAIFLVLSLFVQEIYNKANLNRGFIKICLLTIGTTIFLLSFRYGMERVKPFTQDLSGFEIRNEIKSLNIPTDAILFNCPCPIEIMFFKNCLAYSRNTTLDEYSMLTKQGYQVYIVEINGKVVSDSLPSSVNRLYVTEDLFNRK